MKVLVADASLQMSRALKSASLLAYSIEDVASAKDRFRKKLEGAVL